MMKVLMLMLMSVVAVASASRFQSTSAIVNIEPGGNPAIKGTLKLISLGDGLVRITGEVYGLAEGPHGFHVHEKGDLGNSCKAAGGHFNPYDRTHGGPGDYHRHVGDLGNIYANHDGVAKISISDTQISLNPDSRSFIGGLAIVIHAGEDDLGTGGNPDSLKTGNAGSRDGCGIILMTEVEQHQPVFQTQPVFRPQPVFHQPINFPVHQPRGYYPQPGYGAPVHPHFVALQHNVGYVPHY